MVWVPGGGRRGDLTKATRLRELLSPPRLGSISAFAAERQLDRIISDRLFGESANSGRRGDRSDFRIPFNSCYPRNPWSIFR
jgi:hypothetical protein